jgi:ornithine cyclodeaminase/alanine dehydrogenase-like protein (mu-crystallin family)
MHVMGIIGAGVQAVVQALVASLLLMLFVWRASKRMPGSR